MMGPCAVCHSSARVGLGVLTPPLTSVHERLMSFHWLRTCSVLGSMITNLHSSPSRWASPYPFINEEDEAQATCPWSHSKWAADAEISNHLDISPCVLFHRFIIIWVTYISVLKITILTIFFSFSKPFFFLLLWILLKNYYWFLTNHILSSSSLTQFSKSDWFFSVSSQIFLRQTNCT